MTFDDAPDVSIMIVAYNSAALIADCLAAIPQACRRYRYETLLIDNGDGSTEALVAAQFPWVRIVPSQGNISFARGNNVLAREARAPLLLLLNPDMVACPDAIDRLIDAASTYPSASAWGGVTPDRDGRPDVGNAVHVPTLGEMASRVLGRSSAAGAALEGVDCDAQVEALSGSFVMFRRSAWDEVGGLDDRYFLYCEEVDLFYRLSMKGHTFWRISAARGFHDIGHGEVLSAKRMLFRTAGNMQFIRLHWSKARQALAWVRTH
jgi:GT2 family glycosyltransferase